MSRPFATAFCACLIAPTIAPPSLAAPIALEMPAPATVVGGWSESPSTLRLPVGPFAKDTIPLREAAGAISQRAYKMDDQHLTTLQLITPLLAQLQAAGYKTLFQCETSACGGFDFRYGMDVLPEPQMHIDLGDFRYVAAERSATDGLDLIALLVSRSDDAGYVQVTRITPASAQIALQSVASAAPLAPQPPAPRPEVSAASAPTAQAVSPAPSDTAAQGNFAQALSSSGSVALEDLLFPSGSSALEDKDYASLAGLSDWLKANPTRRVTLVGHTDATGSLAANTTLSRQRAQSVRAALIAKFGADPARIDAQGAGYLAPRASNETPEGRTKNRRVEVLLTPTP